MIAALLVGGAAAGDMDAVAPAAVEVGAAEIPAGPPRDVHVSPGTDLAALVATLPAGSRVELGRGSHRGPLVIDRPLEVWGQPGAVVEGGGQGTVVMVGAPDVILREFRVTGGGRLPQHDDAGIVVAADRFRLERLTVDDVYLGIDLRLASDGVVAGCRVVGDPEAPFGFRGDGIRLWEAHRNVVAGNVLENVRDLVVWYSDHNLLTANRVTGSRYGTHLMHTAGNVITANVYDDDVVGVFTMYSSAVTLVANTVTGSLGAAGVGFGFKESDGIVAAGNRAVANTTGVYLDTTPHRRGSVAWFAGNLVAASEIGLRFHGPQEGAVFAGNGFVSNVHPVAVDGGGNATGSHFDGNSWSDYAGYDLDANGDGDLPFELRSTSGALRDRRPSLAFFTETPAAGLLELLGRAFPMFAPRAILTDPSPRMTWGDR